MKAIIFGSNGQDGFYLKQLLLDSKIEVVTFSRNNADFIGDISEYEIVFSLIEKFKPDYIFHFAATSTTKHNVILDNQKAIVNGTLNILESVRLVVPDCRIFISGSAMQFKNTGKPINEKTPFELSSAYSMQRWQSVLTSRYYIETFGLKIYIGYLFNHDSFLRSYSHINKKIVGFVNSISKGENGPFEIGNILVRKEFNYAGDIVNAIWQFVNQNNLTECVIGSGISYSIEDWVKICFELSDLDYRKYIKINDLFVPEYNELVSDPQLIKSIGWEPKCDINELAFKMLNNKI
jgi:GDPmannose 4,6-dehydratase